jgi:hypothetical protein
LKTTTEMSIEGEDVRGGEGERDVELGRNPVHELELFGMQGQNGRE